MCGCQSRMQRTAFFADSKPSFQIVTKLYHSGRGRQHKRRHGGRVIRRPKPMPWKQLSTEYFRCCPCRQVRPQEAENQREEDGVTAHPRHFQQALTTWELEHLGLAGAVQAVRMIHRATQGEVIDVDRP